jgi:DNA primase
VEGIFDLANLLDKGLNNVSCIFGVDTLTNTADILTVPLRVQGISKIYLMLDGDEAGKKAMNRLKPVLEGLGFGVEIIHLPEGKDPGELSQEEVSKIKEYIDENSGN